MTYARPQRKGEVTRWNTGWNKPSSELIFIRIGRLSKRQPAMLNIKPGRNKHYSAGRSDSVPDCFFHSWFVRMRRQQTSQLLLPVNTITRIVRVISALRYSLYRKSRFVFLPPLLPAFFRVIRTLTNFNSAAVMPNNFGNSNVGKS